MTTMEIASELDRIYDTNLTNDLVKSLTRRSYTLDEIKTLAMDFVGQTYVGPISKLTVSDRLLLSTFIAYLQQREKEEEG